MNDILDKLQQICRVCLLEQSLMFSMLHRSCLNQNISTMIMTCTSIKVNINILLSNIMSLLTCIILAD